MSARKPSEILRAAFGVIETPDKWVQGMVAAGTHGIRRMSANSPDACRWCASGALMKACGSWSVPSDALFFLACAMAPENARFRDPWAVIVDFNDAPDREHHEVAAAFSKAITLAEQSEGSS